MEIAETEIESLRTKLDSATEQLDEKCKELQTIRDSQAAKERDCDALENKLKLNQEELDKSLEAQEVLLTKLAALETEMADLKKCREGKETDIINLENRIQGLEIEKDRLEKLDLQINEKESLIEETETRLKLELEVKDETIKELKAKIESREEEEKLEQEKYTEEISKLNATVSEKDSEVQSLRLMLAAFDDKLQVRTPFV